VREREIDGGTDRGETERETAGVRQREDKKSEHGACFFGAVERRINRHPRFSFREFGPASGRLDCVYASLRLSV